MQKTKDHRLKMELMQEKNRVLKPHIALLHIVPQIATAFMMFFSIRRLALYGVPEMLIGGFGSGVWLNLTLADPTFILPALGAGLTALSFKINERINSAPGTASPFMKLVYVFPVVYFVATASMPLGIHVFWIVNSVMHMAQLVIAHHPKLKKILGLEKTPIDQKETKVTNIRPHASQPSE